MIRKPLREAGRVADRVALRFPGDKRTGESR